MDVEFQTGGEIGIDVAVGFPYNPLETVPLVRLSPFLTNCHPELRGKRGSQTVVGNHLRAGKTATEAVNLVKIPLRE